MECWKCGKSVEIVTITVCCNDHHVEEIFVTEERAKQILIEHNEKSEGGEK